MKPPMTRLMTSAEITKKLDDLRFWRDSEKQKIWESPEGQKVLRRLELLDLSYDARVEGLTSELDRIKQKQVE